MYHSNYSSIVCIFFTFQQVVVTGDITISSDEKAEYISTEVSHVRRQVCGDCDIYDPCQYNISTPSVQENFKLYHEEIVVFGIKDIYHDIPVVTRFT